MHYLFGKNIQYDTNLIKLLKKELQLLPAGSMRVSKENSYYQVIQGKETCITKDPGLIRKYCRKSFVLALLKHIEKKESLQIHQHTKLSAQDIIAALPKSYRNFPLHYYFHSHYETWLNLPQTTNNVHPDSQKYSTTKTNRLRSKSELLITTKLEANQIPHLYELPLKLPDSKTIYPDFRIICPFTGELKPWEHFGLLTDPQYETSMRDKIILYHTLGFQLFDNLIYTFESDITDPNRIQEIIDQIILNPTF
ncbi:MAG: hypothetical protein FWE07_07415 [Turicibacter sp.]|nr:hypothetical protein [Turicibacter sp.]